MRAPLPLSTEDLDLVFQVIFELQSIFDNKRVLSTEISKAIGFERVKLVKILQRLEHDGYIFPSFYGQKSGRSWMVHPRVRRLGLTSYQGYLKRASDVYTVYRVPIGKVSMLATASKEELEQFKVS